MFKLVFLLALLPTFAAAEWAPRPLMFNYDTVFDACTADPDMPDMVAQCAQALENDYLLARAVTRATQACYPETLSTCALPFENEGLPAIAAQIAVSAGCDETDLSAHDPRHDIDANHCAVIITDILRDEGVVPLDQSLVCHPMLTSQSDCMSLASIHRGYWSRLARTTVSARDAADYANAVANAASECRDLIPVDRANETGRHAAVSKCETGRYFQYWQANRDTAGDN